MCKIIPLLFIRKIVALVFIGILLAGSGTAIYFMRVKSDQLKTKYPPTHCKSAESTFIHGATGAQYTENLKTWEKLAVQEYFTNIKL